MEFYRNVREDFVSFCEKIGIKAYFLQKNTKLDRSIRFIFSTTDTNSYDDDVDVVRVDFNINLYAPSGEVEKWNDVFENSIREFGAFDFSLIGTEKEGSGFNTAFIFSKNYFRR